MSWPILGEAKCKEIVGIYWSPQTASFTTETIFCFLHIFSKPSFGICHICIDSHHVLFVLGCLLKQSLPLVCFLSNFLF